MSNKSHCSQAVGSARRLAAFAALTYVTARALPGFTARGKRVRAAKCMLDDPGPCANNLGRARYPDVIGEMGNFRAVDAPLPGDRRLCRSRDQAGRAGGAGTDDPHLA